MKSLAQYGFICALLAVLLGCGKSDTDVSQLKKELADLKSSAKQAETDRDELKQQLAEQKKKEAEQPAPQPPPKTVSEPDKKKDAQQPAQEEPPKTATDSIKKKREAEQPTREEPAKEPTDSVRKKRDADSESPEDEDKPKRHASDSSRTRERDRDAWNESPKRERPSDDSDRKREPQDSPSGKSKVRSQMCEAIDSFLGSVDAAQRIDSDARRQSKLEEALEDLLATRSKLMKSKDLEEVSAKIYVAAYGLKLNAETIAKLKGESEPGVEKFEDAMEKYKKDLKKLCKGW